MNKSISYIEWKLNEEIGVIKDNNLIENMLIYPVAIVEKQDSIYFLDQYKLQLFSISKIDKELKKHVLKLKNIDMSLNCFKSYDVDTFIGISSAYKLILQFNLYDNILFYISYDKLEINPISIDKYLNKYIALLDREKRKIVIITKSGEIKNTIDLDINVFCEPVSIQCLNNGNMLITDEESHLVVEIDNRGNIVWSYGVVGKPGSNINQLACPLHALRLSNENTLITDSMNDRIMEINMEKEVVWKYCNRIEKDMIVNNLFNPSYSIESISGSIIIADSKNNRIIDIDKKNNLITIVGGTNIKKRLLSYPRSVQIINSNEILVADTSNNRILQLDFQGNILWKYGNMEGDKLFWPRSAERIKDGNILIADGRNSRILIISNDGKIIKDFKYYLYNNKRQQFRDPHYVTYLANGNYLIVDSLLNMVIEMDNEGKLLWSFSKELSNKNVQTILKDPHYAERMSNGDTLIADYGNNRLLIVRNSNVVWTCSYIRLGEKTINLRWPRFCKLLTNNKIFLVDGGTACGYVIDMDKYVRKIYDTNNIVVKEALKSTRCISFLSERQAFISDNEGCKIIKVD